MPISRCNRLMRPRTLLVTLAVTFFPPILLGGCASPGGLIALPSTASLRAQVDHLAVEGLAPMLRRHAERVGLPVSLLYAVASRETDGRNVLGDDGNGVGLMQVDARHHPLARDFRDSGRWRDDPEPLIAYAANLLADGLAQARATLPGYPRQAQLHVALGSYNCGVRAIAIAGDGGRDPDACTTGRNYAQDVLMRMAGFEELFAGGERAE